jgi:hypothetical protein
LKNSACCSAKFRISGRSRSVLTPFFEENVECQLDR